MQLLVAYSNIGTFWKSFLMDLTLQLNHPREGRKWAHEDKIHAYPEWLEDASGLLKIREIKWQMEIRLAKQLEIRDCCAHTFTETCLHYNILDQPLELQQDEKRGWRHWCTELNLMNHV